jgi:plastocyanin
VRRRCAEVIAALAALALAPSAGNAAAATLPVNVEFQAFDPGSLDALPGDTVVWTNHSGRRHTVTANDGRFDSDLFDGGQVTQTFNTPGVVAYHCTVHRGMVGEVDVRRITLGPLPPGLVPAGGSVDLNGRTSDLSTPVRVERSTGAGFQTVATATPGPNGTWKARVIATSTAQFRAAVGADVSEARQLLVLERGVRLRATRRGVSVTVVPAAPFARVSLQLYLRQRFGWWPVSETRLDRRSQASFRIRGPILARVAVLSRDGWTPLALSRVVRIGRGHVRAR